MSLLTNMEGVDFLLNFMIVLARSFKIKDFDAGSLIIITIIGSLSIIYGVEDMRALKKLAKTLFKLLFVNIPR